MNNDVAPGPGIYPGTPFETYLSWSYVSNSSLGPALRSTMHYVDYLANGIEPRPSMRLGTICHAGRLEPLLFCQTHVVMPDFSDQVKCADGSAPKNPRSTKAYKQMVSDFHAANVDKTIVTQKEFDSMYRMVLATRNHARAAEYLCDGGQVELAFVWDDPETGIRCKGRADHWNQKLGRISDLKTTADCMAFNKSIANFGYDRQAAFYMDGLRANGFEVNEFCIVAVEKEPPFPVRAAPVDGETVEDGRRLYRAALEIVAAYRSNGIVSGYSDPDVWRKPHWAFESQDVELIIGGEVISV